jgi:DNA invertase Pin-like site-specific DNA recombinase
MKAALYLRTSTTDQHPENQLPALERYCYDRGYTVKGVYIEQESAWKAGHQKELARLLADIRGGKLKFDIVLVWALDRLSREGAAAILNLVDAFKAYGAKVISLQESWTEAPGPAAEIMYAIVGWVAKMESERRSERTLAGLARAIKEGKCLGRPPGSRDRNGRRKSGYLSRWINKRPGGIKANASQ